jgi:hypothetical protein
VAALSRVAGNSPFTAAGPVPESHRLPDSPLAGHLAGCAASDATREAQATLCVIVAVYAPATLAAVGVTEMVGFQVSEVAPVADTVVHEYAVRDALKATAERAVSWPATQFEPV